MFYDGFGIETNGMRFNFLPGVQSTSGSSERNKTAIFYFLVSVLSKDCFILFYILPLNVYYRLYNSMVLSPVI